MLKKGEFAPKDIQVRNMDGELVSLGGLESDFVLVYFYPKDGTPGCTLEARNFERVRLELEEKGVKVIGVSRDSHESHEKFCANNDLGFELWSDVEGDFCNAFGAIVEKNMFGKRFMGIQRSSFLLNSELEVIESWPKVAPNDHPGEVLSYVQQSL